MTDAASRPRCLVYLHHSYTGRGPAESCVQIVSRFAEAGLDTTLFVTRARKPIPRTVRVRTAFPRWMNFLPWRLVESAGKRLLDRQFAAALAKAPRPGVAYLWPDADARLAELARAHGWITVREMINSPLAHAKPILDRAYRTGGLTPAHGITDEAAGAETAELSRYDRIFASNPEVEAALGKLGIPGSRILASSFGWVPDRFGEGTAADDRTDRPFRAVFVGLLNVRKGVPTLLEAWKLAGIDGELVLAGSIEPCLASLVDQHVASGIVRHIGHIDDVDAFYRSADLFVFPTHEEGGPQVTYEAAACGLCIVTTAMGAARLVEDGRSGRLVEAGDAQQLASILRELASDSSQRRRLAENARAGALRFSYERVGPERGEMLRSIV